MQCCFKSAKKASKISVKEFMFTIGVGFQLAILLKNVTHPSQVFYKEIAESRWIIGLNSTSSDDFA